MVWSIALLVILIGADQALKYWTVTHLALGESTALLPGVLQLTRLHNYGAAWSSLSGKTVVLLIVTTALLIAVAWLLVKKIVRHRLGVAAGLFILGGGLGNMIDRVTQGYVVDFLYFKLINFPIFNVADCYVTVATAVIIVLFLFHYRDEDLAVFSLRGHDSLQNRDKEE